MVLTTLRQDWPEAWPLQASGQALLQGSRSVSSQKKKQICGRSHLVAVLADHFAHKQALCSVAVADGAAVAAGNVLEVVQAPGVNPDHADSHKPNSG